jgi:molecular chaperone HtpG
MRAECLVPTVQVNPNMSATQETHQFQAEAKELLNLVIHSLYSDKEIFLRELISNASDACDKLRVEALTNADLLAGDETFKITLEVDHDARTLTITDNGIGMNTEEIASNLGTIARSGTKAFAEELAEAKDSNPEDLPRLIGQFGVGFYSSFMVADKVTVESRHAGQEGGVRWHSEGLGEYSIEEIDRAERGTTITLHLKPKDDDDERHQDFTQETVLKGAITKWSDFVEYPIEMDVDRYEGEDDERKKVTKTEQLNSMKPMWTRDKSDISEEEYAEFYRHISKDWNDAFAHVHFRAEGVHSYTALCYLPKKKGMELFDPSHLESKVQLFVQRVHITSECSELLPSWLRFVHGVVDSDDLPLNISRETLQHNRQLQQIQKRLVKKLLDKMGKMLKKERKDYSDFWGEFGQVLKEGVWHEDGYREDVAKLCLFPSSNAVGNDDSEDMGFTTFGEYVSRMPADQESIWFLSGVDEKTLRSSPHLERVNGQEVLFFTEIDEVAMSKLEEFEGKKLVALDKGEIELDDESKDGLEKRSKELEKLLKAIKSSLGEVVEDVRFSARLNDSPACLVAGENALPPQLAAMLRAQGQDMPEEKRVLELNPDHELISRLEGLRANDKGRFGDTCELLHGQALLAEGSNLLDPARFAKLLAGQLAI